jgi:hypothetical protein
MWRGIIFIIGIVLGGAILLGWAPSPTPTGAASLTTDQGNTDFDVTVTTQGRCGPTCLNVATVITNQQTTQATDVEITAQVFPGYVKSANSATANKLGHSLQGKDGVLTDPFGGVVQMLCQLKTRADG